jgi:hypothetical protein
MTDLIKFAKECPNLNLTVTASELLTMVQCCISETKKSLEQLLQDEAQETYISPKKTAELLDCDLSTLWRWNKSNYLKSIELGGKRRYKMSDLKRILEGGR